MGALTKEIILCCLLISTFHKVSAQDNTTAQSTPPEQAQTNSAPAQTNSAPPQPALPTSADTLQAQTQTQSDQQKPVSDQNSTSRTRSKPSTGSSKQSSGLLGHITQNARHPTGLLSSIGKNLQSLASRNSAVHQLRNTLKGVLPIPDEKQEKGSSDSESEPDKESDKKNESPLHGLPLVGGLL